MAAANEINADNINIIDGRDASRSIYDINKHQNNMKFTLSALLLVATSSTTQGAYVAPTSNYDRCLNYFPCYLCLYFIR